MMFRPAEMALLALTAHHWQNLSPTALPHIDIYLLEQVWRLDLNGDVCSTDFISMSPQFCEFITDSGGTTHYQAMPGHAGIILGVTQAYTPQSNTGL
jgi:hypothetical protein